MPTAEIRPGRGGEPPACCELLEVLDEAVRRAARRVRDRHPVVALVVDQGVSVRVRGSRRRLLRLLTAALRRGLRRAPDAELLVQVNLERPPSEPSCVHVDIRTALRAFSAQPDVQPVPIAPAGGRRPGALLAAYGSQGSERLWLALRLESAAQG